MKNLLTALSLAVVFGGLTASLPAKADFYFTDNDRVILKRVVVAPAQTDTVTYYTPGTAIPETVTYEALPTTVTTQLTPAPEGDTYVNIGGNVYLVDRDRKIISGTRLY